MNLKRELFAFAAIAVCATQAFAAKGGAGGGGGGGGGGGVTAPPPTPPPPPAPPTNNLPQTPPEPDIILRESFGFGTLTDISRPQGGKGLPRAVFGGASLSGFWLEYPGSRSNQWSAQGWNFAGASLNPFEIPSPIQTGAFFNGIAFSDWRDGRLSAGNAIVPFTGARTRYTASAEVFAPGLAGSYIGFGLTNSSALSGNFEASGQIWVKITADQPFNGISAHYEVSIGTRVLASGSALLLGFTPVSITVDPAAGTVSASIDGLPVGTWSAQVNPRFIGFEGQGWADDLIVRTAP